MFWKKEKTMWEKFKDAMPGGKKKDNHYVEIAKDNLMAGAAYTIGAGVAGYIFDSLTAPKKSNANA